MDNPCKYVMIGKSEPVIFRAPISHIDMRLLINGGRNEFLRSSLITSAGFFFQDDQGNVRTFGDSMSLGMYPSKDDAEIIEKFLRGER